MRALEFIKDFSRHRYSSKLHLVINELHILDVPMGLPDFTMHFFYEALSQNMVDINDLPLLGDAQVVLGILFSCVTCRPSYFTWIILPYSSFLSLLVGFKRKVMHVCGDIMGPRLWKFSRPLSKPSNSTTDILWFTRSWVPGWTHLKVHQCQVAESWNLGHAPGFQH
jgi:hypothetical protein